MSLPPDQERILLRISDDARNAAVDLSVEGSFHYAFPVVVASEVFDTLMDQGFLVLGGDLWRQEADGFSHWHAGWHFDSSAEESSSEVRNGIRQAWQCFIGRVSELPGAYVSFSVCEPLILIRIFLASCVS